MYIKNFSFANVQLDLHPGINVIYNNCGYQFQIFASLLSEICRYKYDANICYYNEYLSALSSSFNRCVFQDKDKQFKFSLVFNRQYLSKKEMVEQKDFKDLINNIDYDAMIFVGRGTASRITTRFEVNFENYKNLKLTKNNFYDYAFGKHTFLQQSLFWMNYFIQNEINKNQISEFHCNRIKSIIEQILNVAGYSNFDFSFKHSTFVVRQNGVPNIFNIRHHDIGTQIGMIMKLYLMFLSKDKNDQFCSDIKDLRGIVVTNLDFGERPSYSDNKWKYYDIWKKYFPNIQFIVL